MSLRSITRNPAWLTEGARPRHDAVDDALFPGVCAGYFATARLAPGTAPLDYLCSHFVVTWQFFSHGAMQAGPVTFCLQLPPLALCSNTSDRCCHGGRRGPPFFAAAIANRLASERNKSRLAWLLPWPHLWLASFQVFTQACSLPWALAVMLPCKSYTRNVAKPWSSCCGVGLRRA